MWNDAQIKFMREENERLAAQLAAAIKRADETDRAFCEFVVKTMAIAISGMADGAIVADKEYCADDAMAALRQLARATKVADVFGELHLDDGCSVWGCQQVAVRYVNGYGMLYPVCRRHYRMILNRERVEKTYHALRRDDDKMGGDNG